VTTVNAAQQKNFLIHSAVNGLLKRRRLGMEATWATALEFFLIASCPALKLLS